MLHEGISFTKQEKSLRPKRFPPDSCNHFSGYGVACYIMNFNNRRPHISDKSTGSSQ
jgi:hypothetical protein